jgi:hypothetical protein
MTVCPLVSIIIINYNYAQYVGEAIESALAQTFPNVEVIVVDDGSRDDSPAVIARYAGRVTPLYKVNGGQASALNAAFPLSRGNIILILDSDDVLDAQAVARVVEAWSPSVAKAQFRLRAVDAARRSLGYLVPLEPYALGKELELLRSCGEYPSPPCSGNAFARQVLEQAMPVPEKCWNDAYLVALAPFVGSVVYIEEALGEYRLHGKNIHLSVQGELATMAIREQAIKTWAAAAGSPVTHDIALRIPGHCKTRLISLRLDSASHPFPKDTVAFLVGAGIRAAWRCPNLTFRKRLVISLLFPVLGFAPVQVVRRRMRSLLPVRARTGWLLSSSSRAVRVNRIMQQRDANLLSVGQSHNPVLSPTSD